jgi:hypothetical protein
VPAALIAHRDALPDGRWIGLLVLVSVFVHFAARWTTERPIEVLWCCYASSVVLGVSLALAWDPGISAAAVFMIGIGLPTYLLDLVAGGSTGSRTVSAAFAHVTPSLAGYWYLSHAGLSSRAWLGASVMFAVTQLLSLFTDRKLNINLVHSPWEPVAKWFQSMWLYRAVNLLLVAGACLAANVVLLHFVTGSSEGFGR